MGNPSRKWLRISGVSVLMVFVGRPLGVDCDSVIGVLSI